jgi:hypothetical protein
VFNEHLSMNQWVVGKLSYSNLWLREKAEGPYGCADNTDMAVREMGLGFTFATTLLIDFGKVTYHLWASHFLWIVWSR